MEKGNNSQFGKCKKNKFSKYANYFLVFLVILAISGGVYMFQTETTERVTSNIFSLENLRMSGQVTQNESFFEDDIEEMNNDSFEEIVVFSEELVQHPAVLNQPVKWDKKVNPSEIGRAKINLPKEATNIQVKKIREGEGKQANVLSITGGAVTEFEGRSIFSEIFEIFGNMFSTITGRAVDDEPEEEFNETVEDEEQLEEEIAEEVNETIDEGLNDLIEDEFNETVENKFNETRGEDLNDTIEDEFNETNETIEDDFSKTIDEEVNETVEDEFNETIEEEIAEEKLDDLEDVLVEIEVDELAEFVIEFETPAPYAVEEEISNGKRITVVGPEEVHYENVLAFTELSEDLNLRNPSQLRINWIEGSQIIEPLKVEDTNGNGIYDYVEWIVPHLSNQTFEIIVITKAEHLDEDRNFVEDVYDIVSVKNETFYEIPENNYLRVTFERNLTSSNDITIYAKSENQGRVEVYEKDSNVKIADFGEISDYGRYQIFLTELEGEQDTFDLKVINGDVEFDYVVDPIFTDVLPYQVCLAQDVSADVDTWNSECNYIAGEALKSDDPPTERHTMTQQNWAGVKISQYNPDITRCEDIIEVNLCYEWWASHSTRDCDISFSSDNETTWIPLTTTCPETTAHPGLNCVNITNQANWNCDHFFGEEGVKAFAKSQLRRTLPGRPSTEMGIWSALYFNVTYNLSSDSPYYSDVQSSPPSPTTYSPGKEYSFYATWKDDYWVENVTIEHNFTGTFANYSVQEVVGDTYFYNISDLSAGIYRWRMYADDIDGNINFTEPQHYQINKNESEIKLYLNGTEFNYAIYENSSVNITGIIENPEGGIIYLYFNETLINSGQEKLTNITQINESGVYLVRLEYIGNVNYTSINKTYNITVLSLDKTDPPIITVIYPEHEQKIKGSAEINITTSENAFCKYSTNEFFDFLTQGDLFDKTGERVVHSTDLGILSDGDYTYYIKCNDTLGNINNETNQANATFSVDNTPPGSVTNLQNQSSGYTWIYITWQNPLDEDFNHSIIYVDGKKIANTNNNFYNITELRPSKEYTIKLNTVDDVGNINTTPVSIVANTLEDNPPVISCTEATPDPAYFGEDLVNFTANVTDDFEVENVILSVGGNDYIMEDIGNDLYSYIWDFPRETLLYEYTITAFDRFSNTSCRGTITTIALTEAAYYEHDVNKIFNQTYYSEVELSEEVSVGGGQTVKAFNFTKDSFEDYEGLIINEGLIRFYGGFSANQNNVNVHVSWELVELNTTSGTETQICQTPTGIDGPRIATTYDAVYSSECELDSRHHIKPGNKLRVNIYLHNEDNQARTITHYWDSSVSGSEYIWEEIEVGNFTAEILQENRTISYPDIFDITCRANCSGGICYSLFSYLEYHNGTDWTLVTFDNSSDIFLSENSTNPIKIGTIFDTRNADYFLQPNTINKNISLRCWIEGDFGERVYTNITEVYLIDEEPPKIEIISPENKTYTTEKILVNISAEDNFELDSVWYNWNGTNYTYEDPLNITFNQGINILHVWANDTSGNLNYTNVSFTVDVEHPPEITFVSEPGEINPTESSFTPVIFYVTVFDQNGVDDINKSSVRANFTREGQQTRMNESCAWLNDIDGNSANFSCRINMWYFDVAGDWNISVYAEDKEGLSAVNMSVSFLYKKLISFVIEPSIINFEDVATKKQNATALKEIMLNNTGNANLSVEINSTDLYGEIQDNYLISPNNFSVSSIQGNECVGDLLSRGDFVQVSDAQLYPGNNTQGQGIMELHYCIRYVPNVPSQKYSTFKEGNWIIRVGELI